MFDPDFCELRCPICTRARNGNRVARMFQAIEMAVTFGGCPFGRARQRKYRRAARRRPLSLTQLGRESAGR